MNKETSNRNSNAARGGLYGPVLRAVYGAFALYLIFFEKLVFNETFEIWTHYLILGIPWLVLFLGFNLLGNKFSIKVLFGLIFTIFIINALILLLIMDVLPADVESIRPNGTIYGMTGQIVIITTNFGILPMLFKHLFARLPRTKVENADRNSLELVIIGFIIAAAGGISYLGYFWTVPVFLILNLIGAVIVLLMKNQVLKGKSDFAIEEASTSQKAIIDIGRSALDVLFLAIFSITGFSMMEDKIFQFDLLLPIGGGILIYWLIICASTGFNSVKLRKSVIEQGFAYSICVVSLIVMLEIFTLDATMDVRTGIPAIFIGLLSGYYFSNLIARINSASEPHSLLKYRALLWDQAFVNGVRVEFWLMVPVLLSFFEINPGSQDVLLIYWIAFGIAMALFLLWVIRFVRMFRESETL